MDNPRKYGEAPFNVAVIHGGPGAPGSVAPVAKELASERGVLEPFQTATSLEGQIQELAELFDEHGDHPITLIGHSWGALLSFIFAAHYPTIPKKLILVGSGVFEEQYARDIMKTRLARLSETDRHETLALIAALNDSTIQDKDQRMAQLGDLLTKADSYNPITVENETVDCHFDQSVWKANSVWEEFEDLRANGKLLELGRKIRCPVVAIHGDYDSHPLEGIRDPLTPILDDFKIIILRNCGHYPWREKEARERFFEILRKELN
ncbi:MAG: alpha/beta fold hydrolase [Candidatus Heimdallarchaeota archaeon]